MFIIGTKCTYNSVHVYEPLKQSVVHWSQCWT